MRCATYCVGQEYDVDHLVKLLISHGREPKFFDEVIQTQRETDSPDSVIEVFYYPFGCISIWGVSEGEEKAIIEETAAAIIGKTKDYSLDIIYYRYDVEASRTHIDEEKNEIILGDYSSFVKLSISYALAQSVKLNVLEKSVSNLLQDTTPLQQELANTGKVSLSKRQISQQIGILFNERYSINMHSDILDTPEFFWRRPRYEPIYLATAEFQDIEVRQNILNHRINMIQDLYTMLSNERNYINSARMELIIALLIAFEITIGIAHLIW